MLYTGRFKNRNEETIQVNIITNNSTQQETELKFVDESPVIISQSSSDGIFSPIKSRSCTITIVTNEPYYDMYSSTSHGTKVTVNNLSAGECLFNGYLTPCEYNQPLLYLNEIELEAVDGVSTLQDFIYHPISNEGVNTIEDLIKYALSVVCEYDSIYIPKNGNKIYSADYPTKIECLSDMMFKDDEKGYISWYEILEEICKFYGFSLVPYSDSVYFIDYEIINHCGQNESTNNQISTDFYKYIDIVNNSEIIIDNISKILGQDLYAGDDQNVELDEVYNKISIKADVMEVDSDNLYINPLKTVDKAAYIRRTAHQYKTYYNRRWKKFLGKTHYEHEESTYNIFDRWFYYSAVRINNKPINKYWQCYANTNVDIVSLFAIPVLTDKFDDHYATYMQIDEQPLMQSRLSRYEYQWCTINQQFGWKVGEDVPLSVAWVPYIEFHTGIIPWARYYNDINSGQGNSDGTHLTTVQSKKNQYGASNIWELWWNMYRKELMDKPVLEYNSDVVCNFTPINNSKINYICFTGNLLYQQKGNFGSQNDNFHDVFDKDANQNYIYTSYVTFPFTDAGYSGGEDQCFYRRQSNEENYNKGWDILKCMLKIGDKYWNGTTWTTAESVFWINYHKENVAGDEERLILYEWNHPVTNHDYNQGIGKDCWAIPIRYTDDVYGKITFKIYNPYTPLYNVYDDGTNSQYMSISKLNGNNEYVFDFHMQNCIPVVFMEDLSLDFVSTNNYGEDGYSWIDVIESSDDNSDDDIIYSNTINTNNVLEFDELDLKINTYNSKKPLCDSYLLTKKQNGYNYTSENFKDFVTNNTNIQEQLLINKYVSHYNQPKKIYNCQVHDYYKPYDVLLPNALNNIKMIVDEQEYDVKANTNELKLIEY